MPGAEGTSVVPSTSDLELGSNLMEVVAAVGALSGLLGAAVPGGISALITGLQWRINNICIEM